MRLRYAYILKCERVVKDEAGNVTELRCTYDAESLNGATATRRVKGTIHWVSAAHALDAEVRLYDRLFTKPDPDDVEPGKDWLANLNPKSLEVLRGCKLDPTLREARPGDRFQFERLGYFAVDKDSAPGGLVFNRTVPLRDTWAKIQQSGAHRG